MPDLRLVIFDVDGTLVDSQSEIVAAMTHAFAGEGRAAPQREAILSIVGLSLPEAMLRLCPEAEAAARAALVEGYKAAYMTRRLEIGAAAGSPMFPGAAQALAELRGRDDLLLAVATGKSRRGLDKLIEGHGWQGLFVSQQVSDHHPSKPHPSMVLACLAETGVDAARAVMVGDTSFDMEMGRAAGVATLGVSWGYHAADSLRGDSLARSFADLPGLIDDLTGGAR
jgi:phosphoglycolate phosphatase